MAKHGNNGVRERLEEILDRRIMLLDGSMGALIYTYELTRAISAANGSRGTPST